MGPDAMVLVFCMLSFKPTFWLKKVRNLCHPYSATPANQSEILSNLLQIHFTSCPFYCHPGGVGFHYVTLRLWPHDGSVTQHQGPVGFSVRLPFPPKSSCLTWTCSPSLQNHILFPPQGLALADPTAGTFLAQTLSCWITSFSLRRAQSETTISWKPAPSGWEAPFWSLELRAAPTGARRILASLSAAFCPATARRSPGTWPRAGRAGADTLLNEWINEGNSTATDYTGGQYKQTVQRRDQWMGWERLHSFRSLDALMEGKPSGQTGKDIQWIPISRGLGLTVSLACLGNHEGLCLANLKSSAWVQLKGWAGGLYFFPVQWEAPRWCGLGHWTNVLERWMWWKLDFGKRLKAD